MALKEILLIFLSVIIFSSAEELKSNTPKSRSKRYLVFPEGSSFSGACCMTIGVIGNPSDQFLSWAVNWGVAYNLPNNVTTFTGVGRDPENAVMDEEPDPAMKRRFRRDLYNRLETAMDAMGHNGKECILRALCESKKLFSRRGKNMLEEMVRTVFSLPKNPVMSFENKGIIPYDKAHRHARSVSDCASYYKDCSFSMIDLVLGRYAKHPKNYNFM